jgi:hypothetical protein
MNIHATRLSIPLLVGIVLVSPAMVDAQEPGWSGSAQGSANALFGAAHTRVVAIDLQLARADSALEIHAAANLNYGDDRSPDDGDRVVVARAPRLSLGVDYRPFDRFSPFWFGTVESSLQQRLARRYDGGLGGKATFIRDATQELSLSLALLFEHTRAYSDTVSTVSDRRRWSLRFRTRRRLTPALSITHVSFYQPAVDHPGSYTIDTTTELQNHLFGSLSLSLTLHDRIDSEARQRGAPSNHDGQFLFGLRASF